MSTLENMPSHPRLYRRNATYYHRAAVPTDIKATYPKTEETFSLGTKDHAEAVQKVRVAAAEVDGRFERHRKQQAILNGPPQASLTQAQIQSLSELYYAHLLEEDEETRLEGFVEFVETSEGKRVYLSDVSADGTV